MILTNTFYQAPNHRLYRLEDSGDIISMNGFEMKNFEAMKMSL